MYGFWSWVALGCSSLLCGCSVDDGPSPESYEAGIAALCEGLGDGYERCRLRGSGYDYCGYRPRLYDGRALAFVGECLKSEDCSVLASGEPASECFDEARGGARLRQATVDYCESASLNYFRCNIWWSVEDCTSRMRLWSDSALETAMSCHHHPCEDLTDCEKLAFEIPP